MKNKISLGLALRIFSLIIALFIPVAKFSKIIEGQVPYFELTIGLFVAAIVFVVGIYIDSKSQAEANQEEIKDVLDEINGFITSNAFKTEVLNKKELYHKLTISVQNAKESIYLTTLQIDDPRNTDEQYIKKYQSAMEEIVESKQISVRRILSILSEEKLHWVDYLLNRFSGNEKLRVRYIGDKIYQPLNVQIIDKNEVFIINPQIHSGTEDFSYNSLWFKSAAIADIFIRYYNQVWDDCSSNVLLEKGKVDKSYFAKRRPLSNRCYRVHNMSDDSITIQFSPSGRLSEEAWQNLYKKIREEKDLTSIDERELVRRYNQKRSAMMVHQGEVVSHSSIVTIFSKEDCEKLLKHSLSKVLDFELFEFQGGWTDKKYRGRGLNKILKKDLVDVTMSAKNTFVNCTRNKSSTMMHLSMGWKIISWDKYPFVTSLIGFKDGDKFITRTGRLAAEDSNFYEGDDLTIDLVSQYEGWDDFHFIVGDEEKVKYLNTLIEQNVANIEEWKTMIKNELFFNIER